MGFLGGHAILPPHPPKAMQQRNPVQELSLGNGTSGAQFKKSPINQSLRTRTNWKAQTNGGKLSNVARFCEMNFCVSRCFVLVNRLGFIEGASR